MNGSALRSAQMLAVAAAMLLVLTIASLFVGVGDLSPSDFTRSEGWDLLLASRLPRTLAAVLVGSGLAIAGIVMQTLARNRFVEPATAGTAQSAALGILAATLIWPDASIATKAAIASIGALAGTGLFLLAAWRLPPTQPYLVPLVGLVFGGIVGALVIFLALQTGLSQYVDVWTSGELSGITRGRYELLWLAAGLVALAWVVADQLTVLSLGEVASRSLGLDYARMMQLGLLIVALVSALSVVVVGVIPFVGLVVPALVSRMAGDNLRSTIPLAAVFGALLVLGCDITGRLVIYPYEMPVGTILGIVGAAAFLIVVSRGRSTA